MKVLVSDARVIGKNFRDGENSRGHWEMYELECGNGEGMSVRLSCTKEQYEDAKTFVPYTMEVNLFMRGYNLGGEVLSMFEE